MRCTVRPQTNNKTGQIFGSSMKRTGLPFSTFSISNDHRIIINPNHRYVDFLQYPLPGTSFVSNLTPHPARADCVGPTHQRQWRGADHPWHSSSDGPRTLDGGQKLSAAMDCKAVPLMAGGNASIGCDISQKGDDEVVSGRIVCMYDAFGGNFYGNGVGLCCEKRLKRRGGMVVGVGG